MKIAVPVCVLLALAPSVAIAEAPDPAVVAAIKKITAKDYPSANAVLVRVRQDVVFQPDGQFTNTATTIRKVLTADGRSEAATSSIYYTKDAERVDVLAARVIKADGTVIDAAAKDITDTEQSGEMNIYDANGRSRKITFGSLAVGDGVEVTYRLTRLTPTRENHFNDQFWFQSTEPMLEATYAVDGPAKLPLTTEIYHAERGAKIAATKTVAGDRVKYTWTAKATPQIVPESAMSWSQEVPILVVTTDPSWQHFSAWWAKLAETKMVATPELTAKAAEIVKGKTTEAEKIKALFDFVSADIRYRGLGVGPRTGYTPRPATDTMTSRWGVCRDVSILLTAMLRTQGIKAFPVLTNVGDPVLPKIAYDGFNHAIVALPKPGGGWRYVDPTAKNVLDMLPGNEAEQSTLVSTVGGEPLTKIPAADPATNMGRAIAKTVVAADGSMKSTITVEAKGIFDMVLRSVAAVMTEDQQKQVVEQVIHAALPQAKIVKYATTSALDLDKPMAVTLELYVPDAAVKTGDYRLLRTMVTSGALGLVEAALPRVLGALPSRKYTMDAQVTFRYDQEESVTIPADETIVALPNDAKADNAVSSLASSCKRTNATTLDCKRTFSLKSRFVAPAEYAKLRDGLAQLQRVARQPVVLGGGK